MRGCRLRSLTSALFLFLVANASLGAESAVVFLYHHVDDASPRSTSVTADTFADQLAFLEREDFNVLPLVDLLNALASGREVPERSVAITFDDAYRSIMTGALPLLESRGWPFTVMVNTEAIDSGYGGYLSWDELRRLGDEGASIGNHSVTHAHLVRRDPGETRDAWRQRVSAEIAAANERLQAELGSHVVPVFAYPYGEYTSEMRTIVEAQGLYGLGQQSGPIGRESDFLALPRYPVSTGLGMGDFSLRARSLPLPASVLGTEMHIVADNEDQPSLSLVLNSADDIHLAEVACYATGQGRMTLRWQDNAMREFVIQPSEPLGTGRTRVNCTAPSMRNNGVYYWYGYLWMRRLRDGRWYDE